MIIEIDLEKADSPEERPAPSIAEDRGAFHKAIVEQWTSRAAPTESMVTGLLYVGFDFFPGTPINLVQKPDGEHKYPGNPNDPYGPERPRTR